MEYRRAIRSGQPVSLQRDRSSSVHSSAKNPFDRLQQTIGNQGVLRRARSNLRVISGPEEKPKEEKKEPEVTLEFEGGRKEKADLTKIKGVLWWFNGEVPRLTAVGKYLTQIALATGLPEGQFKWSVTKGADKVKLVVKGGLKESATLVDDSATIQSTAPSSKAGDVNLHLEHTPKGAKKAENYDIEMDVRAPKKLIPAGVTDAAKEGGYETKFDYTLKDNFDDPIPYIDYNEDFGPEIWDSESAKKTSTFPPRTKGSAITDGAAILHDYFRMYGPASETAKVVPPITNPQKPLSTTKILHFWQKWYVGGTTPGKGVLVQTNTGQMYTDHGRHEDIVSPPAAAAPKKGKK